MIIFQAVITVDDLRLNPSIVYVFGDNDKRRGAGGLAKICRGWPNAIGVRTKHAPERHAMAYYSDENYEENIAKIDEDFRVVINELIYGVVVVFPANGIGIGLAEMPQRCPCTYEYLKELILFLTKTYSGPSLATRSGWHEPEIEAILETHKTKFAQLKTGDAG